MKYISESALLDNATSVIVGVSGGPDSVALLYLLTTLFPEHSFSGVYVNHNLRPAEADAEQEFVQTLCKKLGIRFDTVSIDVPASASKSNRSVEDCARHLRYQALETVRLRRNAQLIAVGHTSDDQVEQFFIRLIRGSGLRGLGGMTPRRNRVVRPLLCLTKNEIVNYLEDKGSDYCLDSSNTSRKFLRNRIRLDLLPVLEQDYNKSIRKTVRNTMSLMQAEDDYIESVVQPLYTDLVRTHRFIGDEHQREEIQVEISQLQNLHPALRRRIIEKMFWSIGCAPTFKNINIVALMSEHGRTGSMHNFSGTCAVIRTSDSILFTELLNSTRTVPHEPYRFLDKITINGSGRHLIPALGLELELQEFSNPGSPPTENFTFDADRAAFPLILRAPEPGESFRPLGAPGRKRVSRILSDKKIPRHLRYRFPVIVSGNRIIGLLGLMISEDCKIERETRRCTQISVHPVGQ